MKQLGRIGSAARDGWLVVGISLLMFMFIEGGLRLASSMKARLTPHAVANDVGVLTDTYGEATWPREYEAELDRSYKVHWRPYVYWRRKAFQGEHINVDTSGIRLTVRPSSQPASAAQSKVFMFGGSTMWGTAARDSFTIPSIVASELAAAGVAKDVTNFAETGYVSTQAALALLLELRKGNVPDVVIFYDGVNDTFSAYQQQVAGKPLNEYNRVEDFNLSRGFAAGRRRQIVLRDVSNGLRTVQLSRWLLQRTGLERVRGTATDTSFTLQATRGDTLADEVVAAYRSNIDMVRALGERHGFKSLFYWQPTIFDKPQLTDFEQARRADMESVAPFFQATAAAIRRSGLSGDTHGFHDLSDIFAEVHDPVFVDWCHLRESGNMIIARRIARDILDLVSVRD